jgi:hypothetical protein
MPGLNIQSGDAGTRQGGLVRKVLKDSPGKRECAWGAGKLLLYTCCPPACAPVKAARGPLLSAALPERRLIEVFVFSTRDTDTS